MPKQLDYVDEEQEAEDTYEAFLQDTDENDYSEYGLVPDDQERMINWDEEEYEYYDGTQYDV